MSNISKSIRERAEFLRRELERHSYRYYVLDDPEIEDSEYDLLFRELQELEAAHPELDDPASPTRRVGGRVAEGFEKYVRPIPMMSLDNGMDAGEWEAFDARVRKGLDLDAVAYWADHKLDGLAVEAVYEAGILTLAATRGDGREGEVVTENMRTVRNLPLRLRDEDGPRALPDGGPGRGGHGQKGFPRPETPARPRRGSRSSPTRATRPAGSVRQLDQAVAGARPPTVPGLRAGPGGMGGRRPRVGHPGGSHAGAPPPGL